MSSSRLTEVTRYLEASGIITARLDALALIEHVAQIDRTNIIIDNYTLTSSQDAELQDLVERRSKGREPLAYLTGYKEFYGRDFLVDDTVLIPRPESEGIISLARSLKSKSSTVITDIGCGSGILGITYFMELEKEARASARLVLLDNSPQALDIARQNSDRFSVPADLQLQDITKPGMLEAIQPGVIMANLPYVPTASKTALYEASPELAQEPEQAIFAKDDGLGLYQQLFCGLQRDNDTIVLTECLSSQLDTLESIGNSYGYSVQSRQGLCLAFSFVPQVGDYEP